MNLAGCVGKRIGNLQTAEQSSGGRKTSWYLAEHRGDKNRSCDAVSESRVEVGEQTDSKSTERAGDLRAGLESLGGPVVDHVSGEGNNNHDGHLAPFRLVDDAQTDDKRRDKDECVVRVHGVGAGRRVGWVGVEQSVKSGADGDAETEKKGVDDGVYDSNRSRNDGAGLEFESGTY